MQDESLDGALTLIKVQAQEGLQRILKENQEQWESQLQEKQKALLQTINPECVKLNVGGKKFVTTTQVLTNIPGTKLEKMMTGRYPLMLDHKKRIFIDRNGEYFGYVLDCLRAGKVELPAAGPLRKRIEVELNFFGVIDNPIVKDSNITKGSEGSVGGAFEWKFSIQGSLMPSADKIKLQANSTEGFTIGEKEMKSGVHVWRFQLDKQDSSTSEGYGVFGIVESSVWSDIKTGNEAYTTCYGFSTNQEVFCGFLDEEDDAQPITSIPFGSEVKITYSPGAMSLKLEHYVKNWFPKSHSIEGVEQGVYYPFFYLRNAKITLLETVHKG